jgi:hypothetical protein
MGRKFLTNIELQNAGSLSSPVSGFTSLGSKSDGIYQKNSAGTEKRLANVDLDASATAPTNPTLNQVWNDTTNNVFKRWNGSAWGIVNEVPKLKIGGVNLLSTKKLEGGALERTFLYRCDSELIKCSEDYYKLDNE